ncbi:MAG: TIGR04283 family arsenosugar biosynthesis glycosyltransferase [Alphaproteobacteria bacterium]
MSLPVSIVIPALNAADQLPATLSSLAEIAVEEILVVDGGSTDSTRQIAENAGATVLTGTAGRGQQLSAGGKIATADWLLFLHADTILQPGWSADVKAFVDDSLDHPRVGYFRFALDDDTPQAHRLENIVAWRCRCFSLPYGDQGLLIRRDLYHEIGGFKAIPLMEDVELVRRLHKRIGRAAFHCLSTKAVTASDRYRRTGYLARSSLNLACLTAYWLGVPPRYIARVYG